MKKQILFTLAIVVLLPSCVKGNYVSKDDVVGGRNYDNGGRNYMMSIADNLITGILDEVELAMGIEEHGSGSSVHFSTTGSFTQPGSAWTVQAQDSELLGLKLLCSGHNKWTANFKGDFAFEGGKRYPTTISLELTQIEQEEPFQKGWVVSLDGEREERDGYNCSFYTQRKVTPALAHLQYLNTRGPSASGWDKVYGDLYMIVYKYDEVIDFCILSFEGSPSQATFLRGGIN